MKSKFVLFLIIAIISGCAGKKTSKIEGVWTLVSGQAITRDTVVKYPESKQGNHLKTIGKHYFSTIWQDTTITKTSIWAQGFNGGTYTFENGTYTENISHFNDPGSIGSQYAFKAEFRNDTLVLTNVSQDGSVMIEKWKRIE